MIQSQSQQQVSNQPPGSNPGVPPDCRSEATSICGDNSSVLSGFSGAVNSKNPGAPGIQPGGPGGDACKRDSLVKDNIYVDASQVIFEVQSSLDSRDISYYAQENVRISNLWNNSEINFFLWKSNHASNISNICSFVK